MRARTVERFRDARTGAIREVGEEFTCTRERFEEILKVGPFVEEVPAKRKKAEG